MTQDPRQEQNKPQYNGREPEQPHEGAQAYNTRPGVLGDGTEEQNLNQRGNPEARIQRDEVQDAFGQKQQSPQDKPQA